MGLNAGVRLCVWVYFGKSYKEMNRNVRKEREPVGLGGFKNELSTNLSEFVKC